MKDVVVIGGGIVGLATAWRLLQERPGLRLVLVEKEEGVARHQTGHNSGVIHSGLYYRPGSLKADHCRDGYDRLLAFCREEGITFDICGKVVVATSKAEVPRLEELHRRGTANGLTGLRYLEPAEIREREPFCAGIRGLWVPQTGIVDYRVVAERYAARIRSLGGEIEMGQRVEKLRSTDGAVEVVAERCPPAENPRMPTRSGSIFHSAA